MAYPKAYQPTYGQKYQILLYDEYNREYDHLDYAKDKQELKFILTEYRISIPSGRVKTITLPQKYWKEKIN